MKISRPTRKYLFFLFLILFILENVWITQHSGPVYWVSELSLRYLGYWSSNLSYGIPIILGLAVWFLIVVFFFHRGVFYLEDEKGQPLEQRPSMDDWKSFWEAFKPRLIHFRFPIVMLVISLELMVLSAIRYSEAKMFGSQAECSLEKIAQSSCESRWIKLPPTTWTGAFRVDVKSSSKIFSYVQLDSKFPVLLKSETYDMEKNDDLLELANKDFVQGLLEPVDYSHYVILKDQGFGIPSSQVKIISWQETPSERLTSTTIQFFISLIFAIIGGVVFIRRKKKPY